MIICENKTGFFCPDSRLRIYDKDGIPFYFHDKDQGRKFNLPKGEYITANFINKLKEPVKYKLNPLKPERNIKRPDKITIHFGENPNKASIILQKGIILIDNQFLEYPRFVIEYVLQHEIGHYKFASETGADSYARIQMLKKGYNPTQIMQASRMTLTKSEGRKRKCHENLIKSYGK